MVNLRHMVRAIFLGFLLPVFFLTSALLISVPAAYGQDFILTPSALTPSAVDPGVSASAAISVQPVNTMNAPTVTLACAVTPVQTNGPICQIPGSVVAPATPALTVTTTGLTPEISYTIAVTGTDGTGTQSVNFALTVLPEVPDYIITVTTAVTPSTVAAGSGASGVVTLTPVNGYTGEVTLSCNMVTPPVIPAPQCSFSPATVSIMTSSTAPTATITINTAGPVPQLLRSGTLPALWLLLPGLALAGLGSAKGRGKKMWGWLLLMALAAGVLLMPACGNSTPSQTTSGVNNGTTPNNTYIFTLTGADANGLAPSNTSPTMVSLTVN